MPVIGDSSYPGGIGDNISNFGSLRRTQAPEDGTITAIENYIGVHASPMIYRAVIYRGTSSAPTTLAYYGPANISVTATGVDSHTLSSSIAMTNGEWLWHGIRAISGGGLAYGAATGVDGADVSPMNDPPPDPCAGYSTFSDTRYASALVYTASGGTNTYTVRASGGINTSGTARVTSTLASIDTIDGVIRPNSTHNITTSNMSTLTTATTFGGKNVAAISAPSGDGTFTTPNFIAGQTYPAMGTVTVVASDGTKTANTTTTLNTFTGWQYVNVVGLDTGEWSLGKAFSGGDTPSQLHVINDGTGVLNANGTLTSWSTTGTYTCWARMAAGGSYTGGEMVSFTFTVSEGGVTVYNIKGSGGVLSSGAIKSSLTKTVKSSGGITSTGASKASLSKSVKASGGISTSGTTKNSLSKAIKAIGGAVVSGISKVSRVLKVTSSGGVVTGGSGRAYNLVGAITYIVKASGGIVSSGIASIKRTFSNKGTGGIATTGSSKVQALYKWIVSGAVSVLGAAKASISKKTLPSITAATVSGSARAQLIVGAVTYVIRGAGGINSSGSAKSGKFTEYVIKAIGGVLSAGSALVVRGYKILSGGAVSLSGKAKQLSSRGIRGSGGVVVSGGSVQGSSLDYTLSPFRVASTGELGKSIFRTLKKKTMTIKDPDNVLDYGWDFSPELIKVNDTIQSATVIVSGGISFSRLTFDDYVVSAFISGGTIGTEASATFRIVTDGGRTIDKTLYFTIKQQ